MLQLHIGGKISHPDWKIVDVVNRPEVDYVCDIIDMNIFDNVSVDTIYASHVLEHFSRDQCITVLNEWNRILKPDGKILLSVPDMRVLCWLYLKPDLTMYERSYLTAIIFGGQMNTYDFHKNMFDEDLIAQYLEETGFKTVRRIDSLDIFKDSSNSKFMGLPISINLIVTKGS